jgi:hypothetical protein
MHNRVEMYDGLTGRYTFSCPAWGEVKVRLSEFRILERLPGAAHPAVYKVTFACACGTEHEGLVAHDDLDWAPLGGSDTSYFNLMTSRFESSSAEFVDQAARRIGAGAWPWSFFCYPEERSRPVFPSAFRLLSPGGREVGLAVECPACTQTSVNVVSRAHVDVPFYNDPRVAVVEHIFPHDHERALAAFRAELFSSSFDSRRRDLDAAA